MLRPHADEIWFCPSSTRWQRGHMRLGAKKALHNKDEAPVAVVGTDGYQAKD